MKRFIKNAVLTLLTGGMFFASAVAFGACSKVPDGPKDDDKQHEQVDPKPDDGKDDPTPNPPVDNPPVVEPDDDKKDEENKQRLNEEIGKLYAVLDEAQNLSNFHYKEGDADVYAQYLTDGFNVLYSVDDVDTYYVGRKNAPDGELEYSVYKIYQDENGNWVGEQTPDELDAGNPFALREATFTEFDNGTLTGTLESEEVSASVSSDLTGVTWILGGQNYALDEIGEIDLQIPEFTDLSKPAEEYVYETVNGQREYNVPVLVQTLEEVLKADSSILTKANYGIKVDLLKITHIKESGNDNKILIGAYYESASKSKIFGFFSLNGKLLSADEMTKSELSSVIKTKSIFEAYGQVSTCETSTLENNAEFNTISQNILVKLTQDGCQGNSINNQAEALPEFDNAKVLFGFKTKSLGTTSGGDLGSQSASDYMLVVEEKNGNVEELNLRVSVAYNRNGENYYLLNYDPSKVLVVKLERENIEKDNTKLYENDSNISLNTKVTPYFEEKRC